MGLLAPGAVVAGCRIESVIGRGGMGVVYRALELELGRVVALKLIAPELLENPGVRERFLKEARTAAAIEHPNVVPVYAAGERDGAAFLVMRFIEGDDLRTLVLRDGPPSPARAAELVRRVAAGLDVIHRAGYVHRDVKPANVLVDLDGHAYVTDFGLAKQVLSRGGATAPGHWVGTLDYVAPEQIRGTPVDARADVYALGGVLCFMLTGHVPFERDEDEAKLWAQLSAPPPKPSQLRPGLSVAFDDVVARAMGKEPDARYPSAGDLGRAAEAAAAGVAPEQPERMVARGAAAPGGDATALDTDGSTVTAGRPAPRPPPRSRRRLLPLGLLALAAAGTIVALALSGDPPRTPDDATIHVAETITDVGQRPNGVTVAGGAVWVTSASLSTVERIEGPARRKLEVGLGAASIVSDAGSVWVAARRARRVVELDAESGRVLRRLEPGGPPWRLAVQGGSLWVGTLAEGDRPAQLVRYDASGNERLRRPMPLGVGGLAVGEGHVWVAARNAPDVLRVDPVSGRVTPWTDLAGPTSALYYGEGFLWATVDAADSIVRVDPRKEGARVTTEAGNRPEQIVTAGHRVFVASSTDHSVLVFDPRSAKQVGAALTVGNNPYALAAGDGAVWVTGTSGNTLTRIAYD